jgi:hypothetical protein
MAPFILVVFCKFLIVGVKLDHAESGYLPH